MVVAFNSSISNLWFNGCGATHLLPALKILCFSSENHQIAGRCIQCMDEQVEILGGLEWSSMECFRFGGRQGGGGG